MNRCSYSFGSQASSFYPQGLDGSSSLRYLQLLVLQSHLTPYTYQAPPPLACASKAEKPCTTIQVPYILIISTTTTTTTTTTTSVYVLSSSSPVHGVLARRVEAVLCGPQGPPGNAVASVVQTAERPLEPTAERVMEFIMESIQTHHH